MEDWPEWFTEALKRRFDELSFIVEKQNPTSPFCKQISLLSDQIKNGSNESTNNLVTEWEDAFTHKNSFEKEWLYKQGVKDGLSITRPANHLSKFP